MRFRSKPQEVEAIQWTGDNSADVARFGASIKYDPGEDGLLLLAGVDGAQGWVPVPAGNWIVRSPGDITHHWPVDADYFARKYELVRETP